MATTYIYIYINIFFFLKDSYTTTVNGKRISTANSSSAVKAKKVRMELVSSPGLIEISTSANRKSYGITQKISIIFKIIIYF